MSEKILSDKEYQNWLKKNKLFLKRFMHENLKVIVNCGHRGYISVSLWDGKNKIYEDDGLIKMEDYDDF